MLRSKLAPGARCALEHGGAAPVILAPPYDRDAALAAAAKGGHCHAGQVCVSVQRLFMPCAEAARSLKGTVWGMRRWLIAIVLLVGAPARAAADGPCRGASSPRFVPA